MQLKNNEHISHLSYCTNIHAAEHWDEVLKSLHSHVPSIRSNLRLKPEESFGLGLRVAATAAATLESQKAKEELIDCLNRMNCYVYTINGFPYGNFHGSQVKEAAYKPDWTDIQRLNYTNSLASLLADILPEQTNGTISTVPGSFKPWVAENDKLLSQIADHLIQHVAHLVSIKKSCGKHLTLCLEPEPFCLMETIEETVEYFKNYLFCNNAVKQLSELTKMSMSDCETALHSHIGVCYDVCHAAVEFENAHDSIRSLQTEGIDISKVQLSSALRIDNVSEKTCAALEPFAEPVYLHQVVQLDQNGKLTRFKDLHDALSTQEAAYGSEWRIHFHVPIFLSELEIFGTTQNFLKDILAIQKTNPVTDHLEVETYTWDVLPPEYREIELTAAIAREIDWVRDQF